MFLTGVNITFTIKNKIKNIITSVKNNDSKGQKGGTIAIFEIMGGTIAINDNLGGTVAIYRYLNSYSKRYNSVITI